MSIKEAIRILMLSPFYFKLDPAARNALVREFCAQGDGNSGSSTKDGSNEPN